MARDLDERLAVQIAESEQMVLCGLTLVGLSNDVDVRPRTTASIRPGRGRPQAPPLNESRLSRPHLAP